jgi:hypothetical protein
VICNIIPFQINKEYPFIKDFSSILIEQQNKRSNLKQNAKLKLQLVNTERYLGGAIMLQA